MPILVHSQPGRPFEGWGRDAKIPNSRPFRPQRGNQDRKALHFIIFA
jgi:hypothetical protein